MVGDVYDRTANFVAHLRAWGLEQVGHGLEALNKRLDSRSHDAGSDTPSVKRPRGSHRVCGLCPATSALLIPIPAILACVAGAVHGEDLPAGAWSNMGPSMLGQRDRACAEPQDVSQLLSSEAVA